jgi:type II secretory pathway component PulM
LIPVITRAAAAHEISLNRLQPESNGIISVALQQQSFNQIIGWIAQLEENNGVSVERANFDDTDAPGYVNAQIRLN